MADHADDPRSPRVRPRRTRANSARWARAGGGARPAARGSPRGSRPRPAQAATRASPADEHTLDLELVAEDERSAGAPTAIRPASAPITRAGTAVAASSAASSGTPSACRFRTASIIVSDAAGEDAVARGGRRRRAPRPRRRRGGRSRRRAPAPATASVTSASRPRGRAPDDAHRVGGEVDAVEDDLDDHVRPRQAPRRRRPGRGGVNGRIALKRCVTVPTPRSNAAFASARARVGVAGRDGDSARDEQVDEVERPGQLGCQREQPDRPGGEEPLEQGRVRVAPCGGRMRPEPPGREERAFDVRAEDPRAAAALADLAERGDEPLLGGCDQRRQVRGDAGLEQRRARALVAGRRRCRGSRRRRSRSPGGRRSRARRSRGRSARESPYAATRPSTTSTSPGTSRPPTSAAPRRRAASARARRCPRAASRSQPSRLRPPSASASAASLARRPRPPARRPSAAGPASLSFSGATPTIRFPCVRPSADHRDRRDHVQDELLRRPAFSRVEPDDHLGADGDAHLAVGERGELGPLDADDAARQRAARARCLERADDPGRAAARTDSDDRVRLGDAGARPRAAPPAAIVLGFVARGDERGDRDGERRLALDGVERGQAAGRACADVDEAASGREARGDVVDERARSPAPLPRRRRAPLRPPRSSARPARASSGGRGRRPPRPAPRCRARRRRSSPRSVCRHRGGGQYHFRSCGDELSAYGNKSSPCGLDHRRRSSTMRAPMARPPPSSPKPGSACSA